MLRLVNSFFKPSVSFNVKATKLGILQPSLWNPYNLSASWFSLHSADDRRPKQPLNAYMIFLQEQRPSMKKPGRPTETVKSIASRWKEMSESAKQPYINKQKELQEIYRAERASYNELLSIEEKKAFLVDFREKKQQRQKKSHKKQVRQTDPPKRNRSAYSIYVTSRFAMMKVGSWRECMELMKDARSSWTTMFNHQKQPYIDQANKDKKRYEKEMEEYVERMKLEGKIHLLPLKYQNKIKSEEKKLKRAKKG